MLFHDNGIADERFQSASNLAQLSRWVRGHVKNFTNFSAAYESLQQFFAFHTSKTNEVPERYVVPDHSLFLSYLSDYLLSLYFPLSSIKLS